MTEQSEKKVMNMDLISVIIPIFNMDAYLERCVDSIRKQTYPNLEIVLVDDGSTDRSSTLCDQFQREDSRIKVYHKENEGLGLSRNHGLDRANGKYVTFVDSDDWISADRIENLYRRAKETESACVIGSYTVAFRNGKKKCSPIKLEEKVYEGASLIEAVLLPLIGADVHFPQDVQLESSCCMNLYDRNLIERYHIRFASERETVAEDMLFNVDFLYRANRCVVVNEQGYYYFENPDSVTRKYNPLRFQRTMHFYERIGRKLAEYQLEDKAKYRMMRSFLLRLRVAVRHVVFSDMDRQEKLQEIKNMITHSTVKAVLREYPVETYIPAMRPLMYCMRRGNAGGVYGLIKLREEMRQNPFLRKMLKGIGIGR